MHKAGREAYLGMGPYCLLVYTQVQQREHRQGRRNTKTCSKLECRVVPPLRNFRVHWLLSEYRLRFRIVPKESFFPILPVVAVVRRESAERI